MLFQHALHGRSLYTTQADPTDTLDNTPGCAASGGALALELPRATRSQPESIRIVQKKNGKFRPFCFFESRALLSRALLSPDLSPDLTKIWARI